MSKTTTTDLGLLVMRAMLAVVFVFHGAQKLFGVFGGHGIEGTAGWMGSIGIPFPTFSAVAAGGTELLGGLALLVGLHRLVVVPLVFTMLVAAFTAHSGFDATQGGGEYPLTLAAILTGLGLTGLGRLSLFARWTSRAAEPTPATA